MLFSSCTYMVLSGFILFKLKSGSKFSQPLLIWNFLSLIFTFGEYFCKIEYVKLIVYFSFRDVSLPFGFCCYWWKVSIYSYVYPSGFVVFCPLTGIRIVLYITFVPLVFGCCMCLSMMVCLFTLLKISWSPTFILFIKHRKWFKQNEKNDWYS